MPLLKTLYLAAIKEVKTLAAENSGVWPFPHQGHRCIYLYTDAPGLHAVPEVLLPPGPEILISASFVSALLFPVHRMLSSIPDIPDEPSARVAGVPVIG